MSVVLNASVAIGWILPDEVALFIPLDGGTVLHAPSVLPYEIVPAMQKASRRKRLTDDGAQRGFDLIETLPLEIHTVPADPRRIWTFAAEHGVNAYDAAHLELALRLNLPLATTDAKLATSAQSAGIETL